MDTGTKYAATINPIKNEFAPSFLNKRYIASSGKNKYTNEVINVCSIIRQFQHSFDRPYSVIKTIYG